MAIAGILDFLDEKGLTIDDVGSIRMGTTIGTNALLERKGARTVLVTTQGFSDIVRIGYQNRPEIFALQINLPVPLYERVIEFHERIHANGEIAQIANTGRLKTDLKAALDSGIESCAISLLHGYRYPDHELIAASIAAEVGFKQISISHDCTALMKYVSRTDTTLVDAYLTPLLKRYIRNFQDNLGQSNLFFMQSNGGLSEAELFRGKDSVLSGPAGGLIGAAKAAKQCGFDQIITFDMGGTSTDVAYLSGDFEYVYNTELSGVRLRAPMMDIHTVAAGGGSVLTFDGTRYRVGPQSAGGVPGPMSYRRGGPLTITDANLLLGRIQPDYFPKIFGPNKDQPLDLPAIKESFEKLTEAISMATRQENTPDETAFGFLQIAVAKMANAIKKVSIQRGHDARDCTLVCFGGAGGQVACMIAEELGIKNILIHPLAGLLSAYGIGQADRRLVKDIDINTELAGISYHKLHADIEHTRESLLEILDDNNIALEDEELSVQALLRMEGSDYTLTVPFIEQENMVDVFNQKHFERYGFIDSSRKIILQSLSIQLIGKTIARPLNYEIEYAGSGAGSSTGDKKAEGQFIHPGNPYRASTDPELEPNSLTETQTMRRLKFFSKGKWWHAEIVQRNFLSVGKKLKGPIIVVEANTTTVVDVGWQLEVLEDKSLLLSPEELQGEEKTYIAQSNSESANTGADPITLELFNNMFRFVAEQMGVTLQNTSYSVNIKERLDFSCALFDGDGNLIANAPHMPVHLGSMGESVKNLIQIRAGTMQAGDVYASNDPYNGGTHLPDITVITPAFDPTGERILFYVASRGHHADIGGISPGSMPSDSKTIDEEGILFQQELLLRDGNFMEKEILDLLNSGNFPARNPAQNLADLKAQVAANTCGVNEMNALISKWGEQTVMRYLQYVQDNAADSVRRSIRSLSPGSFTCTMDNGSEIKVRVDINLDSSKAVVDFTGTSAQTDSNLNAPLAVCKAAVLYVFRTLVKDDIPLNAGCFRPLTLIVPEGCILNPSYPAAVVAGNVETSQVIVDALYGALGMMAASQGTMNNLSFGNERYQYYETICGGTGAGDGFNGAGPVQSHMTNSRLTDPEVLESLFPVILEYFQVRENSGGNGKFVGGPGAVRRIRFKESMTASILSNRRSTSPHGLKGGKDGLPGKNILSKPNGKIIELEACSKVLLQPGDCLQIETPGGGGFGEAID